MRLFPAPDGFAGRQVGQAARCFRRGESDVIVSLREMTEGEQ